jgi:mRNA interferase MazF
MKESNIILTIVAQADRQQKNRPALILKELPKYGDLLVCGISTQFQHYTPDFDEIIRAEHNDFVLSFNSSSPALYRFGERREECARIKDSTRLQSNNHRSWQ